MAVTRDHMRSRIAAAEEEWASIHSNDVMSHDALVEWANIVRKRKFIKDGLLSGIGPGREIVAIGLWQQSSCIPELWTLPQGKRLDISLPVVANPTQTTKLCVLHGLAHAFLGRVYGVSAADDAAHDGHFVKLYLDLVRRFYGDKADSGPSQEFKKLLLARNVKTTVRSEEANEKSRAIWYRNKMPTMREELAAMIEDLKGDE